MTDKETRVTSPTGGQKGEKLPKFGGMDALAALEVARVYGFGEQKYERYNYLKGYKWSLSIDALFRHLFAFLSGEDRDPESGLLHTSHVEWHASALSAFALRGIGEDDRFIATKVNGPDQIKPPYEAPYWNDCDTGKCHPDIITGKYHGPEVNECEHHLAGMMKDLSQ